MSISSFEYCKYEVRRDLVNAHEETWERISSPGTWLTGERRVAVAREIRNARERSACSEVKESLSPATIVVINMTEGVLRDAEVELIHRVVCDPGRLSESWSQSIIDQGISEGEYIEIVGVIAMVMILDTFTLGLGLPDAELPHPLKGEPTKYTPPGAKKEAAWLPIVEPEDTVAEDGPMYPNRDAAYIYRGLSAVPQSLRDYWAMAGIHYTPGEYVWRFDTSIRAIDKSQLELIAARVSALHQCAY